MKTPGKDAGGFLILVINPGSTSTKVALFQGEKRVASSTLTHSGEELSASKRVLDQLDMRMEAVLAFCSENRVLRADAVVGRGGLLRPVKGGTFRVNHAMIRDLMEARFGEHASNLGPILALRFGEKLGAPAFIVDPVSVDEYEPCSRISGFPGIERRCRTHALNIKAVARRCAEELKKPLPDANFVVAHLGGGISVCALAGGRIIDSTDGLLGEGPFSMERAGTLPVGGVIDLCFDKGLSKKEVLHLFSRCSGFFGYTGMGSFKDVLELIEAGDRTALLVFEAMVRQVVKWIAAMAALYKGAADSIILTGGMANSLLLTGTIQEYIGHLARVIVYPGEFEMEALAGGVYRILKKSEPGLDY